MEKSIKKINKQMQFPAIHRRLFWGGKSAKEICNFDSSPYTKQFGYNLLRGDK